VAPYDATLLPDLSTEAPAGENLELDPMFGELERAAKGRPETQYGETVNPATPPDWQETEAIAVGLLERTRDLRVLAYLAVARLHLAGLPGFAEMLHQIRWELEHRWQHVHPQLDPEDNNDATMRANALLRLQDPASVLRPLRDLPLAGTAARGTVSFRDIAVSRGQLEAEPGRDKASEKFIQGTFRETDAVRLSALHEAIRQAEDEVAAILDVFEAQAGPGSGPNFRDLGKLLGDLRKEVKAFAIIGADPPVQVREQTPPQPETPKVVQEAVVERQPSPRGPAGVESIGPISTREDALYLLELVSTYFRSNEPSSPVPMLIDRAQRLARMEFLDILRDLAPEGLSQAETVAGPRPE
jgi:type VI secretion system protein ImpA